MNPIIEAHSSELAARATAKLPKAAEARLEVLVKDYNTAAAGYESAAAETQLERGALTYTRRNLDELQQSLQQGRTIGKVTRSLVDPDRRSPMASDYETTTEPSKAVIAEAGAVRSEAEARLRRAREKEESLAEVMKAKGELLLRLETWLREWHGGALAMYGPAIAIPRRATWESARKCVEELLQQIDATRAAALPLAEQRAALRAHIDALFESGKPQITGLAQGRPKISFKSTHAPVSTTGNTPKGKQVVSMGQVLIPDAVVMFAWLHKDALIAALEAEFDLTAEGDDAGLTEVERREKLGELGAGLLAAERIEEILIERAIATGHSVTRRVDTDPRALLGLADQLAPIARAAA